jgi:hypothetical protein
VSETSRSSFATSGALGNIGCAHPSDALRLVGDDTAALRGSVKMRSKVVSVPIIILFARVSERMFLNEK